MHSQLTNVKVILFSILFFLISSTSLKAHAVDQSYIFLKIYDTHIDGRFEMNFKDANLLFGLTHPDSVITEQNYHQFVPQLQTYVAEKIKIREGNSEFKFTFTEHSILKTSSGSFVLIDFNIIDNLTEIPAKLNVEYSVLFDVDEDHEAFLVIEHFWKGSMFNNESHISLTFSNEERSKELDLSSSSFVTGLIGVVKQGIKHIWIGIDHILFILALLIPSVMVRRKNEWTPVKEFKPAVIHLIKVITLFTVAHSVTLSIAAFGWFQLESRLVESIIAISIAIAALDIIYPVFRGHIGYVVFGFGLFHGFGFASVLTKLGILGEFMAFSLFGFNLGVEIGQVVIILFVFPVLYYARKLAIYRAVGLNIGAIILILIALYWFVERAFEIELPLTSLF